MFSNFVGCLNKSRLLFVFCITLLASVLLMQTPAHANPKYASLVMDADTGVILYQRHPDKKLHPASLTKMMTLLMAFEAIDAGKLKLHDKVYISNKAASQVPSKLDLPVGSYIRVEDAIYALVTKSANDIAVALAEKIAGTESNFAVQMTHKARSIGMKRTRFYNASGLHHPRQISTARDMGMLAKYIINVHPNYYKYFSTRHFTYRGKQYRNHNRLLGVYQGMDGMKTGYIRASGFNLVSSVKRGDRRIIGVVFGGRSSKSRNAHMRTILDRGFHKLDQILVASAKIAPKPLRKPGITSVIVSLEKQTEPAQPAVTEVSFANTQATTIQTQFQTTDNVKWADLNQLMENTAFSEFIGEGDFDPEEIKRFRTGLSAIHSLKHHVSLSSTRKNGDWSIQLGAFKTKSKTMDVIEKSKKRLPVSLIRETHSLAPVKTRSGTVYRARLTGFTESQAREACGYFTDCLAVKSSF